MLNLLLMRHAKSSWSDTSLDDFHRPLNKRGRKAVPQMARWMKHNGYGADLALISSAQRTRSTFKLLKHAGVEVGASRKLQRLYLASSAELLQVIRTSKPDVKTLLLIGHNPGLHILLKSLISADEAVTDGSFYSKFPTSAFAHVTFNTAAWSDVAPSGGKLYRYMTPKRLSSQEYSLDDYLDR